MVVYIDHVLGVVSGGRGHLGECGGINNPIHYTRYYFTNTTKRLRKNGKYFFRVKKLTVWIVSSIGEDGMKLCWDEDLEQKRRKMYRTSW